MPWKLLLLPLAVLLPLLAYVAGTLATGPEGPSQPEPVILRDDDTGPEPVVRDDPRRRERGDDAGRERERPSDDRDRVGDNAGDRDDEDDDDDDDPEVVLPSPTQLDDDDDLDGEDDD
jgi:hypothetical protein